MNIHAKPLAPEEIPPHVKIDLNSQRLIYDDKTKKNYLAVDYTCLKCGKVVTAHVSSLRYKFRKSIHSGYCLHCHPRFRPIKPSGGISIRLGYRWVHIDNINPELLQAVLNSGAKPNARGAYLAEHRLVAFEKYGPIVYSPGIIVRHMDGNKLNNAPDNLAIGTNQDNVNDHMTSRRDVARLRSLAFDILKIILKK